MAHIRRLLAAALVLSGGCVHTIRQAARHFPAKEERSSRVNRTQMAAAEAPVTPGHPRLFVRGTFAPASPRDPQVAQWQAMLQSRADDLLTKPALAYNPKHLLTPAREALQRLSLLGGMYQLTQNARYGEAARRELINLCEFPDWQPSDFLATAEMMNAVAIGYDWAFPVLSAEERRQVVDAIVDKGLQPAMKGYASQGGWTTAHHNWNLVCNGGVIVASLAIEEERPAIARRALNEALNSIQNGLQIYDDGGGTPEGPMYHNYATRYLTFAAAALKTAKQPGVALDRSLANWTHAGEFRIQLLGPSGKVFNFGDGAEVVGNSAWMFWHAAQFHRPEFATFETRQDQEAPSMFDLLWYVPGDASRHLPTEQAFEAALVMRQRWNDPNATFLALRQGSNADNHNHLDLGTFVLDIAGQRFAQDLGADNYDLPGYLGNRRADYLRSSTPGHNTLTIGNASQPITASATGELLPSAAGKQMARIDMTPGYPGARSVIRTAGIDANGNASISDVVKLVYPGAITWNLHTPARVAVTADGNAILQLKDKRVQMRIVQPIGARLSITADRTDPPELPIANSTHLRVICPAATETHIVVEFRPMSP
ncbi:MAG: heparinase II/III domain-containing protein [Tepidisphaeraceae bacterium]